MKYSLRTRKSPPQLNQSAGFFICLANSSNFQIAGGVALEAFATVAVDVVWAGAVVATNANASNAAANGSVLVLIASLSFRWSETSLHGFGLVDYFPFTVGKHFARCASSGGDVRKLTTGITSNGTTIAIAPATGMWGLPQKQNKPTAVPTPEIMPA